MTDNFLCNEILIGDKGMINEVQLMLQIEIAELSH